MALRNDKVGSTLNIAGTTMQALAAITHHHGKRRGVSGHRGRKPYERPGDSQLRCFYCTREGQKEADCWLKQDAERLRKERWPPRASAQTARVNHGGYSDEVVVYGLYISKKLKSYRSYGS